MAQTPKFKFTYPVDAALPDGPLHLKDFAMSAEALRLIPRHASEGVRSTQMPAPRDGELSWIDGDNRLDVFRSGAWHPVVPVNRYKGPQSGGATVKMMMGSFQGTTTVGGMLTVAYPVAFPTATITAVVSGGDAAQIPANFNPSFHIDNPMRANGFDVFCYYAGYEDVIPSTALRFNYIAIGY